MRGMDPTRIVLERIREGLSTLVVSPSGEAPDLPTGTVVVRVDAHAARDLGALERAVARIEDLIEGPTARLVRARAGAMLRDRLLREEPQAGVETRFVETANRLAAVARGRAVVAFEGLESADRATLASLARVVARPGWLKLPVLFVSRQEPRGELLAIARALGEGGVLRIAPIETDEDRFRGDGEDVASPEIEAEAAAEAQAALGRIPADVLRVLRACGVVGVRSEARLVAALLGAPLDEVLEALQAARDAGLPLEDRADTTFAMPPWLARALSDSVLPSLRMRWHERLAELLAESESAPVAPVTVTTAPPAAPRDDLRAAAHLASAGRASDALERRLEAAASATRRGDVMRAAELVDAVAKEAAQIPIARDRSRVEARVTLERARLRWLGVGFEPSLTLRGALDEALAARALLAFEVRPDALADAAAIIAGIAYDLGEPEILARAEAELAATARTLLSRGARLEAARLLDDQAALLLRRGELTGARQALGDARRIFETRIAEQPDDVHAIADLGDTRHLLARLALHEPAADDLEPALEHAREAERLYSRIGYRRDVARVWETMGRLEARRGQLGRARDRLSAALRVEDATADLTGIARATAALAEVLASAGDPKEAVDLLASSIELNREKGSPIGLAFDARALARVRRSLERRGAASNEDVRERLERTASRLSDAARALAPLDPKLLEGRGVAPGPRADA